jgi:hypothetical protein
VRPRGLPGRRLPRCGVARRVMFCRAGAPVRELYGARRSSMLARDACRGTVGRGRGGPVTERRVGWDLRGKIIEMLEVITSRSGAVRGLGARA